MKKALMALVAIALMVPMITTQAWAAAPPGPYFNGFETDTAGWFNFNGATITRVPSGSTSTYANGVTPSTGNYYARLGIDPSPDSCTFGGGTAPIYYGPFTRWGGYSAIFPPGGYSTGADIYLDVPYAMTHPDTRFDWSSAINDTAGTFRRDFVFNVGTDALGFVITGGNNATRCDANPYDPGHSPVVHITQSGWYTFKHTFTGVSGGPLVATLTVAPATSPNTPLGAWIRSDPTDIIGVTVGGNRYGWFVQNEFDGLAIDNTFRTGTASTPGCTAKISNGGRIRADNGDKATFGGSAKVSSSGKPSGQETYQDHGPVRPLTFKSISVAAVVCASSTDASIIGSATVNGSGSHEYEIDLHDAGEPGTSDTYRIRIPDIGYDSGTHTLESGNIQIAIQT